MIQFTYFRLSIISLLISKTIKKALSKWPRRGTRHSDANETWPRIKPSRVLEADFLVSTRYQLFFFLVMGFLCSFPCLLPGILSHLHLHRSCACCQYPFVHTFTMPVHTLIITTWMMTFSWTHPPPLSLKTLLPPLSHWSLSHNGMGFIKTFHRGLSAPKSLTLCYASSCWSLVNCYYRKKRLLWSRLTYEYSNMSLRFI